MSAQAAELNRFLAEVEKPAFVMANMSVKNADDALDIVQESMMILASKYATKPSEQWRPLFFRIVQNKTRDFHRRATTRGRLFSVFGMFSRDDGEELDVTELHAGREADQPERRVDLEGSRDHVLETVAELPARQREAFLLRAIEGLSVADTAQVMRCSEGSVKTHYSRALGALRQQLEETQDEV